MARFCRPQLWSGRRVFSIIMERYNFLLFSTSCTSETKQLNLFLRVCWLQHSGTVHLELPTRPSDQQKQFYVGTCCSMIACGVTIRLV